MKTAFAMRPPPWKDAAYSEKLAALVITFSDARSNRIDQSRNRRVLTVHEEEYLGRGNSSFVKAGVLHLFEDGRQLSEIQVAVKVLSESSEGAKAAFREACMLCFVKHPGVVSLLGIYGRTLVTERLGESLLTRIKNQTIGDKDFVEIIFYIAQLLKHLESKGVVHGDVRASNLLMSPDGRPKLIDLGSAVMERTPLTYGPTETTEANPYTDPDRKNRGRHECIDDIYSYGILVWELASQQSAGVVSVVSSAVKEVRRELFKKHVEELIAGCTAPSENRFSWNEIEKRTTVLLKAYHMLDLQNLTEEAFANIDDLKKWVEASPLPTPEKGPREIVKEKESGEEEKEADHDGTTIEEFHRAMSKLLQDMLHRRQCKVAVLGLVKAGKSTFINSLLRGSYLSSGSLSETALLFHVIHDPSAPYGKLYLRHSSQGEGEGELLAEGEQQIFAAVQRFNSEKREKRQTTSVALTLRIAFPGLKDLNMSEGALVIIDTPGYGEAFADEIIEHTRQILSDISAAIVLLDLGQLSQKTFVELLEDLKRSRPELFNTTQRLFIVVNKMDEKDATTPEEIKRRVINLFKNSIQYDLDPEAILFISALRALHAHKFLNGNTNDHEVRKGLSLRKEKKKSKKPEKEMAKAKRKLDRSGHPKMEETILRTIHDNTLGIFAKGHCESLLRELSLQQRYLAEVKVFLQERLREGRERGRVIEEKCGVAAQIKSWQDLLKVPEEELKVKSKAERKLMQKKVEHNMANLHSNYKTLSPREDIEKSIVEVIPKAVETIDAMLKHMATQLTHSVHGQLVEVCTKALAELTLLEKEVMAIYREEDGGDGVMIISEIKLEDEGELLDLAHPDHPMQVIPALVLAEDIVEAVHARIKIGDTFSCINAHPRTIMEYRTERQPHRDAQKILGKGAMKALRGVRDARMLYKDVQIECPRNVTEYIIDWLALSAEIDKVVVDVWKMLNDNFNEALKGWFNKTNQSLQRTITNHIEKIEGMLAELKDQQVMDQRYAEDAERKVRDFEERVQNSLSRLKDLMKWL